MWTFKERSYQKELLDLGNYNQKEYFHCLSMLGKIGRLLGCERQVLREFASILRYSHFQSMSILDVGCGGGTFTARIARHFPKVKVVGIDIDPQAIQYAQKHFGNISNLQFKTGDLFQEDPDSFDIVTATLVCHHLKDSDLQDFIQQSKIVARHSVIFNDLHRSPLAYILFFFTAPILFSNRLIFHDGLLSIKRSFIRSDWYRLLKNHPNYKISWHWPFRYIVRIKT